MPRTLIQFFLDTVDRHHKPAQFMRKQGEAWLPVSADAALATVESLALALESLGIARGDRVAILSETRLEWALTDLAALGLGAITVPIYHTLTAAQIALLLRESGARAVVVSGEAGRDRIRAVRGELPGLEFLVVMDAPADAPAAAGEHGWAELVARGAERRARQPGAFRAHAARVRPEDVATIIFTSGTTGDPKGAMLTHGNIGFDVESCLQLIDLGPDDTCLSFLPLSHVFERMAGLYAMLAAGATIAYAEHMDLVGRNAAEVRPTVMMGVPRFYEKVYVKVIASVSGGSGIAQAIFHWGVARGIECVRARFAGRRPNPWLALEAAIANRVVGRQVRQRMGGRLRFVISGGAPLATHVIEFYFAIGIRVLEGYGLTETSPVICLNRPGHERPGSVGPPIPGVEVRIADNGEILTRGPHVMQGYYRNPDATRAAIEDGWFHTGDIGRIEPDGALTITDRLKDVLVTAGGKKIPPQPIEARLREGGWLTEAVLIGDRRPYVIALLVPDFAKLEAEAAARGWPLERHALLAHPPVREIFAGEIQRVNAQLSSFEQIKKFELIDHELTQDSGELTPSLKVKRRVIMERYAGLIEPLYGAAPRKETAA